MKLLFQLTIFTVAAFMFGTTQTSAQQNVSLAGILTYQENLNDIWGYSDTKGNEYALVGTVEGTSIVDVTNPANPQELFFVNGPNSTWRDLKTYQQHAYIVTEGGQGVQIVDLSGLPDSINTSTYAGSLPDTLHSAHNIFIDEQGFAYVVGHNPPRDSTANTKGSVILDLNQDLTEPPIVGVYKKNYVHDIYVRNDTMWTAEIFKGNFSVVDVTNKSNPQIITSQPTPNRFSHNTWLSDDGNTLFTTDERTSAFITSYDVSNLNNINELDRFQANPGSQSVPHNVFVNNNHLVASYYKDGLRIIDATRPSNLIETGYFDTSPLQGDGFAGSWGTYPYLPSGNILASDVQEGLFILSPQYTRACYLEGSITDSNGLPLTNVTVEIMGTDQTTKTNLNGEFTTGTAEAGDFYVRLSSQSCGSKILPKVTLQKGQVTNLNAIFDCKTFTSISSTNQKPAPDLTAFSGQDARQIDIQYTLPGASSEAQLIVADIYGKIIHKQMLHQQENQLHLPVRGQGIYIVHLRHENKSVTKKVRVVR